MAPRTEPLPGQGRAVALLTRHGKEELLRPVLEPSLGCRLVHVDGFDTDLLGTFTRETPRPGTQLDAARRKARIGMELAGCRAGVASEGSFGTDPVTGMLPWDVEIVVWIDDESGLEVTGFAQGPAQAAQDTFSDLDALLRFAGRAGFPGHWLVLRPDSADDPRVRKGIDTPEALERAFRECLAEARSGRVAAETDLRAHANPTRQALIREAAENLVARLRSHCPGCGLPGFWLSGYRTGLPCGWCGEPTREPVAETWSCLRCEAREERLREGPASADPGRCDRCNP